MPRREDGDEFGALGRVELCGGAVGVPLGVEDGEELSSGRGDAAHEVVSAGSGRVEQAHQQVRDARSKAARPMSWPQSAQSPRSARSVVAYSQVAWRTALSMRLGQQVCRAAGRSYATVVPVEASSAVKRVRLAGVSGSRPCFGAVLRVFLGVEEGDGGVHALCGHALRSC